MFVEVYISTPLEICEQRDTKGLYEKARKGIIKQFTGINDPYEEPKRAEVIVNTVDCEPEEAADQIIGKLVELGVVKLRS